jgi:GntR family transcriptional regulator/MocR family aminotransferase
LDWIKVDRESSVSLTDQLFLQIRESILNGILVGGYKLPPTRQLSQDIGLSRNIVVIVYEQLVAESYIETIKGHGTYVCKNLLLQNQKRDLTKVETEAKKVDKIYFTGGIPDLSLFPVKQWLKSYTNVCYRSDKSIFAYPNPVGEFELRYEISQYLLRSRGLVTNSENIIVTGGSSRNFSIISEVLKKHQKIVLEDPFLNSIRKQFESLGKETFAVRVDNYGLKVNTIPDIDFDFLVATPSHQYPLAVTLSAKRRIELINLANKKDFYILEDDYDSEFRYEGNRLSTLFSLSPQRIIYSGTFSKSVSPALRIGFLIVPNLLLEIVKKYIKVQLLTVNKLEQLALAEFIKNGYLERDLATKKKMYNKKFTFLKQTVNELFGDRVEIQTNSSGLHLILFFKDYIFSEKDMDTLYQQGLIEETVAKHSIVPEKDDFSKLIVAFSNISETDLLKGLNLIKKLID